ncbi:MAG: SUMF1/EgtB/PvdO family nonheme iron enzyme, partial [Thermoguttaceae bacterium]|nr:SUMF1/EgtB/PvdO family nonheme iron enzyme [Thermoguttaceae bacterium]
NFADSTFAKIDPFSWAGRVDSLPAWRPADWSVDDRSRVSAPVGSYAANPFGLFDVQGNVAEWTSSEVVQRREVVDETGAVVESSATPKKVVCGGSWRSEARKGTLDAERYFPARFNLRDVGFRVICVD